MNQNALLLATAGLLGAHAALYTPDVPAQQRLFQRFKEDFGRSYAEAEEPSRFHAFVQNLKVIDERNAQVRLFLHTYCRPTAPSPCPLTLALPQESSAVHGITQFSDITQEEFAARYLTAKSSAASTSALRTVVDHVENTYNGTASLVDWSGVYTTPVKDQVREPRVRPPCTRD